MDALDTFFSDEFGERFGLKKQALVLNASENAMMTRYFGSHKTNKTMRDFEIKLLLDASAPTGYTRMRFHHGILDSGDDTVGVSWVRFHQTDAYNLGPFALTLIS